MLPTNVLKKNICLHLKFGNSYQNTKVQSHQVVSAILYRLKTGCQWRQLPMRQFFRGHYSWKSVYYHFQKWSKDGSWDKIWEDVLYTNRKSLDMSCVQLDGTHTLVKRGGAAVGYQGRKKGKTTNMLILTDAKGTPVSCSSPISGEHNDAFELVETFKKMITHLNTCKIAVEGLFLNADAGFDVSDFRNYCQEKEIIDNIDLNPRNGTEREVLFDDLLYKNRFVIERTNAWMDAFKALLIRFETNSLHWKSLCILAFIVILLRQL
jgi:transposase